MGFAAPNVYLNFARVSGSISEPMFNAIGLSLMIFKISFLYPLLLARSLVGLKGTLNSSIGSDFFASLAANSLP